MAHSTLTKLVGGEQRFPPADQLWDGSHAAIISPTPWSVGSGPDPFGSELLRSPSSPATANSRML